MIDDEHGRNILLKYSPSAEMRLECDKMYLVIGYSMIDLDTQTVYLQVVGSQLVVEPRGPGTLIKSEARFANLRPLLSPIPSLRIIQLLNCLIPEAKIMLKSRMDPWIIKELERLYSYPGQILSSDEIDHRMIKLFRTHPLKIPQILIFRPSHYRLIKDISKHSDVFLNFTLLREEELVAEYILKNRLFQRNRIVCEHLEGEWTTEASEGLQEYFIQYREIVCRENDQSRFPIHQPARQLELFRCASESSASLRGTTRVTIDDVAMAALLGDIMLEERYGRDCKSASLDEVKVIKEYLFEEEQEEE